MSTFQTPFEHHVLGPAGPGAPKLAPRAAIYFFLVAAATTLAAAPPISHLKAGTSGWTTFAILAAIAATAQLFVVSTPRHQSYHTTIVFLIPAVMLLPPPTATLALSPVNLVAEERTLKGSYIGTCVPSRDIPRYIELFRQGRLPVDRLMTGKLKLEDINLGFDLLHEGKVVRQIVVF